jgi:hypothetical protein
VAGPNLTTHLPIIAVQNRANTAPLTNAIAEAASQTFQFGTPVSVNASGYVVAWPNASWTNSILGISESFGQNLSSNGLGAPVAPFGGITGTGAIQTYGYVPNEPSAVNIALGTPVADGRTLFLEANLDTVFEAMCDNSVGTGAASWTPTQATIAPGSNQFGLTLDSSSKFWYVDFGVTGAHAVLQVVGINPLDGLIANARVRFKFLTAAVQNLN